MGKVLPPSFQATLRALNLKPRTQSTAAHGLCLTAGPWTLASLPRAGWGQFQGELESQHLQPVLLQPLSLFQVQTNKDGGPGRNLDRLATGAHDSALPPLLLCQQEKVF